MDETKIYIHVILALTPLHLVEEDLVISFFVLKKNNVWLHLKANIDIWIFRLLTVVLKQFVCPAEFYSCQGGNTSKTTFWL